MLAGSSYCIILLLNSIVLNAFWLEVHTVFKVQEFVELQKFFEEIIKFQNSIQDLVSAIELRNYIYLDIIMSNYVYDKLSHLTIFGKFMHSSEYLTKSGSLCFHPSWKFICMLKTKIIRNFLISILLTKNSCNLIAYYIE